MTPEERIEKTKQHYNYNQEYNYNNNDVLDYFGDHKTHKQASKIYWYYSRLFNISPSSDNVPPVKTPDEYALWFTYHQMMKKKFYYNK